VIVVDVKHAHELADLAPALDCSHHLFELVDGDSVPLDQLLISIVSRVAAFTCPAVFDVIVQPLSAANLNSILVFRTVALVGFT
jgi:hypothetical protein